MGERRGVCGVLVGKPEGKKPLGRPSHRWKDKFNMDFQEVDSVEMDWTELVRTGTGGGYLRKR